MHKGKVIFLLGPTAVGKSTLALKIAKKINAEIISCDSMQVYKGMDIVSSKPSPLVRKNVPHHLIDIISPKSEFNVSSYRRRAVATIKKILRNRKIPLFVGGSGLYANAVLDGIFRGPGEDKGIRKRLYHQAEVKGAKYLYQRLQKIDPEAAEKIDHNDLKRIVRALEVWIKTKKPISEWQKKHQGIANHHKVDIYCLNRPRGELYTRINKRVDEMFKKGVVNEVKGLLKNGLSRTAHFAIGIIEIKGYLEGRYGLDETRELIKKHTRQYAKRQLTWFRKDKRINWINLSSRKKRLNLCRS